MVSHPPCLHLSPHDNMNYVVDSMEFEDRWNTILFTVSVNFAVSLLYSLYAILFLFSIRTLHRRIPDGKFTGVKLLLGIASIMFVLATIGTIITISTTGISMRRVYLLVQGYTDTPARLLRLYHSLALGQEVILAVKSEYISLCALRALTQEIPSLGSWRKILVLPAIVIIATVGDGLTYNGLIKLNIHIDPRVPFGMGGTTNILLINSWYIRWEVQTLTGPSLWTQFDTAVAIMTIFNGVAWGLVQLGVNIVPTLILVRVGLGCSTETTLPALSFDCNTRDKNRNF
ncbi:hypothetical protein B0H14DRAFT_2717991 [Mycena olivaceomarginata]|nr:hypothetical protein B0H14DRAFT_2717991 [Mycena olivaceomarginata]